MKRLLLFLTLVLSMPAYADCFFREDTASQTFLLGPFLDGTDGISAEVSLTVANTDIRISKNGGNTVAKNSGGGTHDEAGMYQITLDATDTNTAGTLQIYTDNTVDSQSIVPVFHECVVYATGYFDLLDGTTALLTSRLAGNALNTTVTTATSQTSSAMEMDLADGMGNDDAYNQLAITFVNAADTSECHGKVSDYTGTGAIVFVALEEACSFTVAASDFVFIQATTAGSALQTAQNDLDTITGPNGALLTDDAILATKIATNAIGSSAIAADAIGASEIANNAIGADQLAASAVDLFWDEVIETAGVTYTGRCLLAALGAYIAGTVDTAGNTSTYKDTGGNLIRIVGTTNSTGRGTMSITCP